MIVRVSIFGPLDYPRGSLVIAIIRPLSMVRPSLNISETTHMFFLILDFSFTRSDPSNCPSLSVSLSISPYIHQSLNIF